jgi:hypothetical protein
LGASWLCWAFMTTSCPLPSIAPQVAFTGALHKPDIVIAKVVAAWPGEVGKLQNDFAKRGVKLLALSCNDADSHKGCARAPSSHYCCCLAGTACLAACFWFAIGAPQSTQSRACRWIKDIEAYTEGSIVNYPIICDPNRDIATLCVTAPEQRCCRQEACMCMLHPGMKGRASEIESIHVI